MKFFGNKNEDYHKSPWRDFPLGPKALLTGIAIILLAVTKILFRWKIEGVEKLEEMPGGKGRVIIMNHVSALDPIIVVIDLFFRGVHVRPIYKGEFDEKSILGWFITRLGGIPVRRGTADMKALRAAAGALKNGDHILIYPEGTRVRSDDEPREIHGGFALIANMAEADILPMAIVGAADIKKKGSPLIRPVKVWVRAGDPIHVGKIERKQRKERLQQLETESMDAVFRIRDELRAEHPGRF